MEAVWEIKDNSNETMDEGKWVYKGLWLVEIEGGR